MSLRRILDLPTVLLAGITGLSACVQDPTSESGRPEASSAKSGGGGSVSVQAADPAFGHQGDPALTVTITGSGFDEMSQAGWERNGLPDPKIAVLSTQFISSTTVKATINIAGDANLAYYDIAVTARGGRKGIGTELFEVTQATLIQGTSIFRGINENGLMGGGWYGSGSDPSGPRVWTFPAGLERLAGGGIWTIDEAGQTMSGFGDPNQAGFEGPIPIWTRSGAGWQRDLLPMDPLAVGGVGRSIVSDPIGGTATLIAGSENFKTKGNSFLRKPRVWRLGASGWERQVLPSLAADGTGYVEELSASGVAVGGSNNRAAIWEPNGTGGWSVAYLPGSTHGATGINSAGDLIVGAGGAYWERQDGGWVARLLPIPCGGPRADVDDFGRIVATGCQRSERTSGAAVFVPPYSTTPIWLGGLGKPGSVNVEKMSIRGSWIVGQIGGNFGGGVYWRIF